MLNSKQGGYQPVASYWWFKCKRCGVRIQRMLHCDWPYLDDLVAATEKLTCEFCGMPRAYALDGQVEKKPKPPPESFGGPKVEPDELSSAEILDRIERVLRELNALVNAVRCVVVLPVGSRVATDVDVLARICADLEKKTEAGEL